MIETLEKTKFEAINEIAKMTMQISDAKITLKEIEDKKDAFISKRENETTKKIQKLLEDSEEVLIKARNNFTETHELLNIVTSYAESLNEGHKKFTKMFEDFNNRNELWSKNIELQTLELSNQKKLLMQDEKHIKDREEKIKRDIKMIEKDKGLIESRQEALTKSYNLNKDLWEKLTK